MADEIETRLRALEVSLELLRAALGGEIRTRRLAVVDEEGVERVVLGAEARAGTVLVRLPGPAGRTTGMELYAAEQDGGQSEVGLYLIRDGDVVCRWGEG
ncbi:MAG TPA: hypothetical protein VEW93_06955 [Acidimicrobiales bacterium]|nr:hypothetical protein [Acidimicrobiales bacterium]